MGLSWHRADGCDEVIDVRPFPRSGWREKRVRVTPDLYDVRPILPEFDDLLATMEGIDPRDVAEQQRFMRVMGWD